MIEQSLSQIDLKALCADKTFYPSPHTWEDEVLYFLLIDRFSDGKENAGFLNNDGELIEEERPTPLFQLSDSQNCDHDTWFEAGKKWCGGNLKGLKEKLGYLKRLGVTAVWISPVFKQTKDSSSYHGYGIQNFLDVDPNYGSREELKALVKEAHRLGIRVILDIILNHAGNVFAYENNEEFNYRDQIYPIAGYRTSEKDANGSLPFEELDLTAHPQSWPHGAIWPREFQSPDTWTRKGKIGDQDWDKYPVFLEGDFYSLKDISHGCCDASTEEWDVLKRIRTFSRNKTLHYLSEVFMFWIAYADIDGYRIDTVKHMEPGAVRYFCNVIHEFAQSIGKENFYLIGEITGGRQKAMNLVDTTGLDAGLGIDDIQDKLEFLAKGRRAPSYPDGSGQLGYFNLFNNSLADSKNSHQWYGKRIVTMFDDHDQVGTDHKFRYCGQEAVYKTLPLAFAVNLTTLGIPCIYYGSEQAFNGKDKRTGNDTSYSDVYLRECMFGGAFGSLQSINRHFFNEEHEVYKFVARVNNIRKKELALRRGRQYLREVSENGDEFFYPTTIGGELRYVVAWSRVFHHTELVCTINTDVDKELTVWVTIDKELNEPVTHYKCVFSSLPELEQETTSVRMNQGRRSIQITVPPAGFTIWSNGR